MLEAEEGCWVNFMQGWVRKNWGRKNKRRGEGERQRKEVEEMLLFWNKKSGL